MQQFILCFCSSARSGTSQAAAITSGAVALILQKYPTLHRKPVEEVHRHQHREDGVCPNPDDSGSRRIRPDMLTKDPARPHRAFPTGTGTGTLEGARGSDHLTVDGVVLQGEQDIFGPPRRGRDGDRDGGRQHLVRRRPGTATAGRATPGRGKAGAASPGAATAGRATAGAATRWCGNCWSGNRWSGNSWSGNSWSGNSWSGQQLVRPQLARRQLELTHRA